MILMGQLFKKTECVNCDVMSPRPLRNCSNLWLYRCMSGNRGSLQLANTVKAKIPTSVDCLCLSTLLLDSESARVTPHLQVKLQLKPPISTIISRRTTLLRSYWPRALQ